MKKLLYAIIPLMVLVNNIKGYDLKNTSWIGEKLEYLSFSDTTAIFDNTLHYETYNYKISNDSLFLYQFYTTTADSFMTQHKRGYCYIIDKMSNDTLALRPFKYHDIDLEWHPIKYQGIEIEGNKECQYLVDSNNVVKLVNANINRDTIFHFLNIVFKSQNGNWIIKTFIDSNKNIYYCCSEEAKKKRYYQGIVTDSNYTSFISILRKSKVDKIRLSREYVISTGYDYKLEVAYSEKRIKTEGTFVPYIAHDLFDFMSNIHRKVHLVKSKEAKKILSKF